MKLRPIRLPPAALAVRGLVLLSSGLSLLACEKTQIPPRARLESDGGGNFNSSVYGGGGGGGRDGGRRDAGGDGGEELTVECDDVAGDPPRAEIVFDSTEPSASFTLDGTFVAWDTRRCDDPTLLIGLADRECSLGSGDLLVFAINRDAADVELTPGVNRLRALPDDTVIRVELVDRRTDDYVIWGTCGGSSGTLTVETWGFDEDSRLSASFEATLTDCLGNGLDPVTVSGRFEVVIPEPFETSCR